jgi:hypothetical protein
MAWLVEHIDDIDSALTLPNHALYPILDHPLCELLMDLFQAGKTSGEKDPGMERCRYLLANPPQSGFSPPALIDGNMLIQHGFKPGPSFSRVLQTLWNAQLDGLIKTREEGLRLATSISK